MNKSRKTIVAAAATAFVLLLAVLAVRGYILTKVATIVDDEAAWDLRDASPSMKVLLLKDGTAARFVCEKESAYVGEIQDSFEVSKAEAEVVTWYACDGRGVVYLKECGIQPAFSHADETSPVVGQLRHEDGYIPETYRCLSFKEGWFAIEIEGSTGYIQDDKVIWDAIDSF